MELAVLDGRCRNSNGNRSDVAIGRMCVYAGRANDAWPSRTADNETARSDTVGRHDSLATGERHMAVVDGQREHHRYATPSDMRGTCEMLDGRCI